MYAQNREVADIFHNVTNELELANQLITKSKFDIKKMNKSRVLVNHINDTNAVKVGQSDFVILRYLIPI